MKKLYWYYLARFIATIIYLFWFLCFIVEHSILNGFMATIFLIFYALYCILANVEENRK